MRWSGKVMSTRAEQPLKAAKSMTESQAEKETLVRDVHKAKAPSPMSVARGGKTNWVMLVQL